MKKLSPMLYIKVNQLINYIFILIVLHNTLFFIKGFNASSCNLWNKLNNKVAIKKKKFSNWIQEHKFATGSLYSSWHSDSQNQDTKTYQSFKNNYFKSKKQKIKVKLYQKKLENNYLSNKNQTINNGEKHKFSKIIMVKDRNNNDEDKNNENNSSNCNENAENLMQTVLEPYLNNISNEEMLVDSSSEVGLMTRRNRTTFSENQVCFNFRLKIKQLIKFYQKIRF